MSIPSTSTRRPVAVAMLFLAVILLGIISYLRLPIDLLPDVSYPGLVVYTSYPDVAPAEVERLITERIEAQSAAVPGVERVTSVSREGVSLVTLRFSWGTDMDFAMLNVRERLDNIRDVLPETATRPRILRVDPESEPVMVISVAGGGDLWETKELAETVFRRRLEQLDGVAEASVTGGLDREIQVEVYPRLLDSYGVSLAQVGAALEAANVSAPGGTVLRGRYRYPLRTLGEFQTVEEIADVVVARQRDPGATGTGEEGGFRLVRLSDVGMVIDGYEERESIARYNGAESVGILVFKESGANTVQVARDVSDVLEQLRVEFPRIQTDVASSQAGFISDSISNVVQALVIGGLLAFLVLFLFLRDPRYPVAIALAIPISIVGTFALLDASGISLNIMSLGGLALGVGMLVDNSIVVLENIFRHREEGKDRLLSAAIGAEEVQRAITASTLTTISVFGPIIYVEGVAGELFGSLSLAVAFSLLVSLVVALTLLPTLAARFGGKKVQPRVPQEVEKGPPPKGFVQKSWRFARLLASAPGIVARGAGSLVRQLLSFWAETIGGVLKTLFLPWLVRFDRAFQAFAVRYHAALEWSLDNRGRVVAFSVMALAGALLLGVTLDRDLLPDVDQGAFDVRLELAEGTGLPATNEAAHQIEETLLTDEGVEAVFTRVGRDVRTYAESEKASGLHTAVLQVRLADGYGTAQVLGRVRALESRFPTGALSFEVGQATALGQILGGVDADIAVRVRGEDLDLTYPLAEMIRDRLTPLPELGNVRVGTERGQPQIQLEILPEAAARYGIEPSVIAQAIQSAVQGDRATEFVDFDRKIGIVVRLPDDLRYSEETLRNLRVQDVPLRELVRLHEAIGPAEIHREDQGRIVTVYADVISGGLDGAIASIRVALDEIDPPRGVRTEVGGENEEMRRSFQGLIFAFSLALLLVYMILAAQFESFIHPFTILMAVPLAVVGAVLALWLTGEGINTMSLIGVVILVGIVVNDSIIKVDFINQARAKGMAVRAAILEAGRVRLRPIIMTTATTVLGLTPMAMGLGRGADLRAPLAIAVIGGEVLSTALMLLVVPVVYSLVESVRTGFTTSAVTASPSGPETVPEGAS